MALRILTLVTNRNAAQVLQPSEPAPSTINQKTVADFTRVVEQTGILKHDPDRPRE